MDDLLLTIPTPQSLGFRGPGDFEIDAEGVLTHRGEARVAPLAYMGVHMLDPAVIDRFPAEPHSMFGHWMDFARTGRLYGVVAEGTWMHVGDPEAREAAHARLAGAP
jgi:MurNAc alpha-1-phosphate uridylyltransferase